MTKSIIPAKEAVKKYKISYHTLNYYTTIGLLRVLKKEGNIRYYDAAETSQRMAVIVRLSKEGYPLRLIRKRLSGF